MKARYIEVFHAVYTTGSVSRAASYMNISQPSVSKLLRHTEDSLGFSLFDRRGGKLQPTKEAHELFKYAAQIQDDLESLKGFARSLSKSPGDAINVMMTPGIGLHVGPSAIQAFRKNVPNCSISIDTSHFTGIVNAIKEGKADVGIVYQPFPDARINQIHIADAELVCVSELESDLPLKGLRWADLDQKSIVMLKSSDPLGVILSKQLEKRAPDSAEPVSANTYYIAKTLAAKGVGYAVIDEVTARSPSIEPVKISYFRNAIAFSVMAIFDADRSLSQFEKTFVSCIRKATQKVLND
ncbi:MAG: LysR family transcriptional regulator [Pseudomonadota bacterium]